ncbi:serine hydrolase domain-containing protein [Saccharibacillus alkalitolerans]|uniref:Beta-lactamase family protein n=1 Tax=Saccharibacillus alkalitolerans TaxID=2705290 RepID=A0ABX0F459_9BACL|nr:serine hydrolase domain-containing protein [Saccharibacillus alkalitolerans]NGZ75220.1 beta-lactamase family protein [Saccharibacillus alkalitolerans]
MIAGQNEYAALPKIIERAGLEVNSLVLLRGGRSVLEWYRKPYRRGVPQLLYSLSKSFTSIAVGIACDRGLLKLDDPIVSFFPDKLSAGIGASPNLAAMKVRHLLSMTAGHEGDIYPAVVSREDWAAAFLEQPVEREPGTHYRYSTPSSYMLSAVVERVSGMNLVDFLMPTLFDPLGIARPAWEVCPLGVTAGGMGLSLATEDVAKVGQMLLDGGLYDGRRILSAEYVKQASSEQSDNRAGVGPERIDSAQGYGFQFHLCRFGAYRGDGSFGQLCLISPKHGLVAAAGCAFPSMGKLQTLLDFIFELSGEAPPRVDRSAEETDADLEAKAISGEFASRMPFIPGAVYELEDNPAGLLSVSFRLTKGGLELTADYGGEDERSGTLPFDFGRPLEAEGVFVKDLSLHRQRVVTSAESAGEGERILRLTMRYIETPYIAVHTIREADGGIEWRFSLNVSFGFKTYKALGRMNGTRAEIRHPSRR